jgi:hypothetical protein
MFSSVRAEIRSTPFGGHINQEDFLNPQLPGQPIHTLNNDRFDTTSQDSSHHLPKGGAVLFPLGSGNFLLPVNADYLIPKSLGKFPAILLLPVKPKFIYLVLATYPQIKK